MCHGPIARWTSERVVCVRVLIEVIVLCSWLRHFTLTVPLSTHVCKWVPVNLTLGVALQWTSGGRGKNLIYCSLFTLQRPG